jgi:hypothetical protein
MTEAPRLYSPCKLPGKNIEAVGYVVVCAIAEAGDAILEVVDCAAATLNNIEKIADFHSIATAAVWRPMESTRCLTHTTAVCCSLELVALG